MGWGLPRGCQIIVDIDCDLANDPSEIKHAIELIKKYDYDIVLTSKYLKGSVIIGRTLFINLHAAFSPAISPSKHKTIFLFIFHIFSLGCILIFHPAQAYKKS